MRIGIGIPTYGRAAILGETFGEIMRQTRKPDRIVICAARPEDVPEAIMRSEIAECLLAAVGLPRQRNAIIEHLTDCDVVLFLDDDFVMQPDYLEVVERVLLNHPDAVVVTGTVLADGASTQGIALPEAREILRMQGRCTDPLRVAPVPNGYGCNMAIRLPALRSTGVRFDETLPLYAWQEDAALCCELAAHGEILRVEGARGVHLGVKTGRSAGLPLGYSQVANPLYIARRIPRYTLRRAIAQVGRNVAANLLHSIRPEPWVDRRGRLRGNLLGLVDALRGRLHPERVLAFAGPSTHRPQPQPLLTVPERLPALSRAKAAPSFAAAQRHGATMLDGTQVPYRSAPGA